MAAGEIKSDRISFSRSLAGRLLLLGILPASALMAAVLAWGAWDKFHNLEVMAEDELLRQALFTAAKIEESMLARMAGVCPDTRAVILSRYSCRSACDVACGCCCS